MSFDGSSEDEYAKEIGPRRRVVSSQGKPTPEHIPISDRDKEMWDKVQKHPSSRAPFDKTEEYDMRSYPENPEADGLPSVEWLRNRHSEGFKLSPDGRAKAGLGINEVTQEEHRADRKRKIEIGLAAGALIEDVFRETLGDGVDGGGGQRLNAGKNRLDLLPPEWAWALADVTTQGTKKYSERNWEEGMKWSTMVGCMARHLLKFQSGQRYDGDEFDLEKGTTGCHELAMVAWNALALMSYDLRNTGENDIPKPEVVELFSRVNAALSDLANDIHRRDK